MNAAAAVLGVLWSDLRRRPGTALASLAAVASGVAVFVAILLAGSAARSSFVSAVQAVAGRATHEITAEGGLDETRFPALLELPHLAAAQPVVEGRVAVEAVLRGNETVRSPAPPLRLLGVDPFRVGPFLGEAGKGNAPVVRDQDLTEFLTDPNAVVLPQRWAEEAGAQAGDTLRVAAAGRIVTLRVLAVYELDALGDAARDSAVIDIAAAQELLDKCGRLDRVDVSLDEDDPAREAELSAALPPGERLQRPERRGERVARMIDAFRLNLLALGGLALVVGALLVFNAAQFSVVRRNALLGQLRALGITRPLLMGAVLAEVVSLGLVGGALGLALGSLLANRLAGRLAETITDLYAFVQVDVVPLTWPVALLVLLGTAGVAAAAGFFPALDAARTPPRMVGLRSREEGLFRAQLPRLAFFALLFCTVGVGALNFPTRAWWPGLVAAFAFVGTGACLLPAAMALLLPPLRRLGERLGLLALPLAGGALSRSLSRTGGAASALGVALAMTIGVITMVKSFESEVRRWIDGAIRADLFISDVNEHLAREDARVPEGALRELAAMPEVEALDTLRKIDLAFADRTMLFFGVNLPTPDSRERFEFLSGDGPAAIEGMLAGETIVSEPLANRYNLGVGDTLAVNGRRGVVTFKILGVFRDFSYDRGYAVTGEKRYLDIFGETGVRNVAVYLKPGVEREAAARAVRERFAGRYVLNVRSNAELRGHILDVFNHTFALTYLLQTIATVFALGGITVTLFGLFLERAREIATLRALGSAVAQVGRLFAMESLLMALFPVLLALPLGAVLAWILVHVINLRSYGWSIAYAWPWAPVLGTCALAVAAGLCATLVPWALARRQSIAGALREE